EKILTSRTALEGERKQVTVLFADLKGSMELLADRDPEEARAILDPILEQMMEAVHRYEGTVNQVMGDGIMALFGEPVAHEDHAGNAASGGGLCAGHVARPGEREGAEQAGRSLRADRSWGGAVSLSSAGQPRPHEVRRAGRRDRASRRGARAEPRRARPGRGA